MQTAQLFLFLVCLPRSLRLALPLDFDATYSWRIPPAEVLAACPPHVLAAKCAAAAAPDSGAPTKSEPTAEPTTATKEEAKMECDSETTVTPTPEAKQEVAIIPGASAPTVGVASSNDDNTIVPMEC
jgi:hypothetical protein